MKKILLIERRQDQTPLGMSASFETVNGSYFHLRVGTATKAGEVFSKKPSFRKLQFINYVYSHFMPFQGHVS